MPDENPSQTQNTQTDVTFVGNQEVVWGTNGVYSTGLIVDSASVKNASDQTTIADNNGNVKTVVIFNKRKECTVTFLAKSDSVLPAVGSLITIAGVVNCIVGDATENWSKGAAKSITINATYYETLNAGSNE